MLRSIVRPPRSHPSRWVVWTTWAAILTPIPYGVSRILWAVGIPLGIDGEDLREEFQTPGGRRVRRWLVIVPLLAPIFILASFNHWSLQYVVDGFAMPPEVAEDMPGWSFWGQVGVFWIWGVALAVATAAYAWDGLRLTPRRLVS
jgi:hypothetical protein